jgi:hypothetical protein
MKTYKIILLSVLFSFVASVALAQDLIVKRDAEEIEAKVEEITDTHIKYHKFSNLEGPVYSVAKSEVLMIKYANGEKDVFTSEQPKPSTQLAKTTKTEPVYAGGVMSSDGSKYYMNGKPITDDVAMKYAKQYPDVFKKMREVNVVESIGGFFILCGTLSTLAGVISGFATKDWRTGGLMSGIGLGGFAVGIGIASLASLRKAAAMYNDAVNADYTYSNSDVRLSLAPTMGGLGLQLTF